MNIILVLIDSLNRRHLSAYNATEVRTPNLSAFAERAYRFDNHFVGSLPCMPARREIFAGFKELMWRPWGPLEPFDHRLPKLLGVHGYTTGIVTDHYHYWEEAANGYLQAFASAKLIRGHELDFWQPPLPEGKNVPQWVENIEAWRPGFGRRYYANVKDFEDERDFFPAKVMTEAANWLERNQHHPFFLQVESFDVHEPFDVPEPYASLYGDGGARDRFTLWPPYQDPDRLAEFMAATSDEELKFIRAQYAGKLGMVDRWFGDLLHTLDRLELWDDTAVIVTTDHGHDLGERGVFGKQYPHFDSHANIPLLVWHPQHPSGSSAKDALTTTVDLFATVLEMASIPVPDGVHSRSFLPVVRGERDDHRDALLYGTFGQGVCLTDGEWTVFKSPVSEESLFSYSSLLFQSLLSDDLQSPVDCGDYIPNTPYPQWKMPLQFRALSRENFLFNRKDDPDQKDNLWKDEAEQRKRMLELLIETITDEGAPVEQLERLGLEEMA